MHSALEHGSVEEIQTLINQKADVNAFNEDGCSPLVHAAARNRVPKIMQTLVDAKADPNLRSEHATGTSPAAWAELLERGKASSTSTHSRILSPLTWATLKKSAAKVEILIDAKADVNYLNVPQDRSSTALFLAVEMGSLDITRLLVEAKADLDALNQDSYTVLDVAQEKRHHDIAQLLLDAGAPRGVWWRMQQACMHGHAEEVKSLLDAGHLLHIQDSYSQMPLLQHGHTDIAQMLIAARAQVNVPGTSLLLTSIKQNNVALVRSLVAAHADVNVRDHVHCPIMYSVETGNLDLTKLLIDARADVNLTPRSSPITALHIAAERGDVNAVRLLIDAKADMNYTGDNRTPLACAAKNGQLEMMKLLLEAKAPVDGNNGLALSRAIRSGNTEAVQILLDAKATLENRDSYLMVPLDIAISRGDGHLVTMLLAAKALVSSSRMDDPLTVAATFDNTDIMKILIDAKAPLEAAAGKRSPLLAAIENQKLGAMRLLLEAKAVTDISGTDYEYEVWSRALYIGTQYGNYNVLTLLLDTHQFLASKRYLSICLGIVYQERHYFALQILLERGFPVDNVTINGVPILYQAVYDHLTTIVKLMIDAKANVNVRGREWDETPLILASRRRYRDIVPMLLEAKANLDATDRNGYTALRQAVNVLHYTANQYPVDPSIVQMLLDAKAPVEYNAVRAAVDGRQPALLRILVGANENLRVRNKQAVSLLMLALENNLSSILETLLTAYPSLLDRRSAKGKTALMIAVSNYRPPQAACMVKMLLEQVRAHCAREYNDDEPPAKRFKRTE